MESYVIEQTNDYGDRFATISAYINCLKPLLSALGWPGDERQLAEALPHFSETLDCNDFCQLMSDIHYEHASFNVNLNRLDPRLMPCLFVPKQDKKDKHPEDAVMVLLAKKEHSLLVFDGSKNCEIEISNTDIEGTIYLFSKKDQTPTQENDNKPGWFRRVLTEFRGLILQVLAISCMLNFLALATPLFIMFVYDKVIGANSKEMLFSFSIGIAIALLGTWFLYLIRARILAYIGGRLDNRVSNAIFERLLYFPPSLTESAMVGTQVARIKDFDSVKEFLTGPFITLFFDLPFVIIFLFVIAVLGGPLVLIPLVMVAIFFIMTTLIQPLVKRNVAMCSTTNTKRREFLLEALSNMRVIRYTGSTAQWNRRYREYSAAAATANYRATVLTAITNAASDAIMIFSGIIVLSFGVIRILDGLMSIGALIAIMILVWRVLSPLKGIFSALTRMDQVRAGIRQINLLMQIKPERAPKALIEPLKHIKGSISFNRVSLRYLPEMDPALIGVSFATRPKETIAIVGKNGSGKSTILKLITGLYQPQAGNVRIDGQDIRQMDPVELRQAIAYVPQTAELFYGTITQNLLFAHPLATQKEMIKATQLAGVYTQIMASPDQFETQVRDQSDFVLPPSFQQGLSLARAYLKAQHSSMILYDEPVNALDEQGNKALTTAINHFRDHKTQLFVTHRPSHLELADRIIVIENGQLIMDGTRTEIMPKIAKDFLR